MTPIQNPINTLSIDIRRIPTDQFFDTGRAPTHMVIILLTRHYLK